MSEWQQHETILIPRFPHFWMASAREHTWTPPHVVVEKSPPPAAAGGGGALGGEGGGLRSGGGERVA